MRISDWSSDVCSSDLRVETTGAATQIMLNNGTILSFVDAGAFTVETDGSITVHSGNATILAARDAVRVNLPGGAAALVAGGGGAGTFNLSGGASNGNVLSRQVTFSSGAGTRSFAAGRAWQATGSALPMAVIANAPQAVPAVLHQRTGGLAAAAINGQPVGFGQALAAVGASGDVVAAATRLQASAQNPSLTTFPAADAATLVNYAASLSHLYGAPTFQGAGPDLVRTYLGYLGNGGSPARFQSDYADLVSRYIELLRGGGLPANFSGANEAAINAYLNYIRATGAYGALPGQDQSFINAYLDALANGTGNANFLQAYTQAINSWLAYLQSGGLPSTYDGFGQDVLIRYLEALRSSGALESLVGAQAGFLSAYLDYLAGGGNPDQFAGLPGGGPIDPGQPDPNQPAGTNMRGRSEERRVGQECVRTCRTRWSPLH